MELREESINQVNCQKQNANCLKDKIKELQQHLHEEKEHNHDLENKFYIYLEEWKVIRRDLEEENEKLKLNLRKRE